MQRIQYVSKYIAMAEEGLVPHLECPMDQGFLLPNQDLENNLYLYCISCNYKKFIGFGFYDEIVKSVKKSGSK